KTAADTAAEYCQRSDTACRGRRGQSTELLAATARVGRLDHVVARKTQDGTNDIDACDHRHRLVQQPRFPGAPALQEQKPRRDPEADGIAQAVGLGAKLAR